MAGTQLADKEEGELSSDGEYPEFVPSASSLHNTPTHLATNTVAKRAGKNSNEKASSLTPQYQS